MFKEKRFIMLGGTPEIGKPQSSSIESTEEEKREDPIGAEEAEIVAAWQELESTAELSDAQIYLNTAPNGQVASLNTRNFDSAQREERYAFQERLDSDLSQFKHSLITTDQGSFLAVNTRGGHFLDLEGNEVQLSGNVNFMPVSDPIMIQQLEEVREGSFTQSESQSESQPEISGQDNEREEESEVNDENTVVSFSGLGEVIVPADQERVDVSLETINRTQLLEKFKDSIPAPGGAILGLPGEYTTTGSEGGYQDDMQVLVDTCVNDVQLRVNQFGETIFVAADNIQHNIANIVRTYLRFVNSDQTPLPLADQNRNAVREVLRNVAEVIGISNSTVS